MSDTDSLRYQRLIPFEEDAFDADYDEDFALNYINTKLTTPSRPEDVGFNTGHKEKIMTGMQFPGSDKFMNRLFRRADGIVWDLMTGNVGVSSKEGISTLVGAGDDAYVAQNMFDQFGMEVPAFAQATPVESVNLGDLIYFGASEKPGWIIDIKYGAKPVGSTTPRRKATAATTAVTAPTVEDKKNVQFTLMKVDGQRTTWKPPKVTMLGMGDNGVMVIRSLMTMLPGGNTALGGMQSNMMMMMQMSAMSGGNGSLDMEKLMPLMLMGAMSGDGNGGGNMMQTMMLMSMLGNGDSPMSKMFGSKSDDKSGYNQPRGNGRSPFQG